MRIRTNTTLTPAGRIRVKTTARAAPMMPAVRTSTSFSLVPTKKRRRKKKR